MPKESELQMTEHVSHKAVRNVFFSGVRLAIGVAATVCTSAMMARTLGPGNMGMYGYAMWLVGTLGIVANVGLPAAIIKFVSEYIGRGERDTAARVGRRLLRSQFWVALLVAGLTVACILLKRSYRDILLLTAAMILMQALQQSLLAALAGVQRFDRIARISLYTALAQVASVAVAALLHFGVLGMLWATLVGVSVGTGIAYFAVNSDLLRFAVARVSGVSDHTELYSQIRRFSFTISYILVLDTIVWQRSEVLFLKWYSTLSEIAFYTLAYSIVAKIGDVAGVFTGTLLPLYSESYGRNGLRDLGPVFRNSLKYLQMAIVPLCALGLAVARPLVQLLYGSSFLSVVLPLQILMVSLAFTCIGGVGSPLLVGTGKQSFIAKYGTFVAILNLTLDFVLIPSRGAFGAAVANCSAQVVGVLGGTIYTLRYVKATFPWRSTVTIYLAALVAVVPVLFTVSHEQAGILAQALSIALGSSIYIAILVIAGQLGRNDIETLRAAFFAKIGSSKTPEINPV